jgi:hypothetical protein
LGVVVLAHVRTRWTEREGEKKGYICRKEEEEEGGMKEMQPGETTQSTTSSTRLFSRARPEEYIHIPPLSLSLIPLACPRCCPKNIPGDK